MPPQTEHSKTRGGEVLATPSMTALSRQTHRVRVGSEAAAERRAGLSHSAAPEPARDFTTTEALASVTPFFKTSTEARCVPL